MEDGHYSIKAVAKRTGLSTHVIRIWEKRYGAVKPARTQTRRRLYSDAEVERLNLLRLATRAGHSIGNIASLSEDALRHIVETVSSSETAPSATTSKDEPSRTLLDAATVTVYRMDAEGLEQVFQRGMVALGTHGFLQKVLGPLAERIGDLWRDGSITAAQEHFASAVIRNFLATALRPYAPGEQGPVLVVATPTGQLHELGAVMVGAAASDVGWRVVYLGASLPAPEIAGPAIQHRARAVALSLIYPDDDPALPGELGNLRRLLPPEISIIVGGRAAAAYASKLDELGVRRTADLNGLYPVLDGLRSAPKKSKGSKEDGGHAQS